MREIRTSGSEGGGTGNSTGPSYPYRHQRTECQSVVTGLSVLINCKGKPAAPPYL